MYSKTYNNTWVWHLQQSCGMLFLQTFIMQRMLTVLRGFLQYAQWNLTILKSFLWAQIGNENTLDS